jgi:RNA polymerase sigma-70 factor, ECF subfamily
MLTGEQIEAAYVHYRTPLQRYITRRIGHTEGVEDLLGDVFCEALEHAATYEDRGWSISAWLYRIARSRTSDYCRVRSRRTFVSVAENHAVVSAPDEAIAAQLWCHTLLVRAQLTAEQRTVINLRFFVGHDIAMVAAHLGKSAGAVKALQHRALERLAIAATLS